MKSADAGPEAVGLTRDDVWHLVDYIRSLPYESTAESDAAESPLARITARQFEWEVRYPGEDGRLDTLDDLIAIDELHLPLGEPATIELIAPDVRQQLTIPGLFGVQTIRPGQRGQIEVSAEKAGKFELIDAGPCGWGHYKKRGRVVVGSRDEFTDYLDRLQKRQTLSQYSSPQGGENDG